MGSLPAQCPACWTVSSPQPPVSALENIRITARNDCLLPNPVLLLASHQLVAFDTLRFLRAAQLLSGSVSFQFLSCFFFPPFILVPECLHSSALWAVPTSVFFIPCSSTWVPLLVNLCIPLSASFAISAGPYQSFSLVLLSRHLPTFPLDSGSLCLSELLPLHPEAAPLLCSLSTAGPPSKPLPN